MAAGGGGVSGGAGVVNLSLSDNALGLGDLANNIFCGFDKKCRREKNKTPDAPDNYNFVFNDNGAASGGVSQRTIIIIGIVAAAALSIFLLTQK
ncbi:hypothetical protein C7N43_34710 [Sphingobacteriales bacterium UPWRP_1]|nr:hypothetical protein C7N43_34710 [Sphingobacteriales bacterium UPWRP_1]